LALSKLGKNKQLPKPKYADYHPAAAERPKRERKLRLPARRRK
jgi:hypothetical protein